MRPEFRTDPKPDKRIVMMSVGKAVLAAEPACRVCGSYSSHAHHLVRRSQGGDDVVENLVALCSRCHRYFHDGKRETAHAIWKRLKRVEIEYILQKKGRAWFEKVYPYELASGSYPSSDADTLGPSAASAAEERDPVPRSISGQEPSGGHGARGEPATADAQGETPARQDPGASASAARPLDQGEPALLGSDPGGRYAAPKQLPPAGPHGSFPLSPAKVSDGGGKPCKRCHGDGQEPPKLDTPTVKKGATGVSIKIPVAEQEHGAADLRADIAQCGELLSEDRGYDAGTPAYYILKDVIHEFREGRS